MSSGHKIEDQEHNRQAALLLAAHYDLPGGADSDAHAPDGIGAAYLKMPDFDGPADFLAGLRHASVAGEHRPRHPVRTATSLTSSNLQGLGTDENNHGS